LQDDEGALRLQRRNIVATVGKTIAEKILSRSAGRDVRAGDIAICVPDFAMGTDGSIPMALDYLQGMHGEGPLPAPRSIGSLAFAFDHYGEASGKRAVALQQRARDYAHTHGVKVFETGEGIGHQCVIESGEALPGRLMLGADSHAVSYGALNAFATGIGSSDLAGIFLCNQVWLRVPHTMRVSLHGALPPHASAKDVALALARQLGADGASYMSIEFMGPAVLSLDMDDRIVLSNMSVEMGAKAGIFPCDSVTLAYLKGRAQGPFEAVHADADASYAAELALNLSAIRPQVALPHRVDQVVDLADMAPVPIDMVYLGTCTGGRVKDYREALDVLRDGGGVAPNVRLVVTPASEAIRAELEENGMLAEFSALGADIQPPGCGACCGTCGSIPEDGTRVISTANRNFKGRMGNRQSFIYLASPKSCAAAATRGTLIDPGKVTS
jgi:3-isopropylmalate/(R)-2-methylmalate dehydratase large subunit